MGVMDEDTGMWCVAEQCVRMTAATPNRLRRHLFTIVPILAFLAVVASWGRYPSNLILVGLAVVLVAAVLTAVHHAEVIALRVGEPYGSVILAVAVTVIEAGLIVVLMLNSPETTTGLARDAVFAAIMIAVNGVIGVAIVAATLRGGVATFNAEGTGAALAAIATLAVLSLVLPNFTTSAAGPVYSTPQLIFAASAALVIYIVFVFVQNVRHRDFFLPPPASTETGDDPEAHMPPPSSRTAALSAVLLILALLGVVGLAKATAPLIESGVDFAGLPTTVIAVSIALLVLLPESIAAVRASVRGRMQTSFNLGYGSMVAAVGLTIPTVAVISLILDLDLQLGLTTAEIALLALTLFVSALTVAPGRATLLEGTMHLAIFAGFLVFVLNP